MTNREDLPTTVAVPVAYIRRMEKALRDEGFVFMADQAKKMLPQPRSVAAAGDTLGANE